MPHRCVHCSKIYQDGSQETLEGCSNCHSKFFFYIKAEKLKEIMASNEDVSLTPIEKRQMENDVREIAGLKDEETPIFLDFESVKVLKPGKYLIDLAKLFSSNKPRIYQIEDGKYIVDLTSALKMPKESAK